MHTINSENEAAARRRYYKLINWNIHVEKVEQHFNEIASHAKAGQFFEDFYVSRNDAYRQIQLLAGKHPIGFNRIPTELGRSQSSSQPVIESGAALVVSQSALGTVIILLYPFVSDAAHRQEPYIIWKQLDNPSDLTPALLKSVTNDFFRYMRVSSVLFEESGLDRLKVYYLLLRGRKLAGEKGLFTFVFSHWFWVALGALGSIASIYSVLPTVK